MTDQSAEIIANLERENAQLMERLEECSESENELLGALAACRTALYELGDFDKYPESQDAMAEPASVPGYVAAKFEDLNSRIARLERHLHEAEEAGRRLAKQLFEAERERDQLKVKYQNSQNLVSALRDQEKGKK